MSLPKISTPTFRLNLPSSGKEIRYRQFLVKEEKILLVAKESGEQKDLIDAFKTIVGNCVIDSIDVQKLALFDLEYVFLMIRAKSQSNISKFKYVDDGIEYDALMDYDQIKIDKNPAHEKTIDLDGKVGIVMRYPTIEDLESLELFDEKNIEKSEKFVDLMKICIESVYDDNDVYPMKDSTKEEQAEFFDSLSSYYLQKIQNFFATFPVIVGTIEYLKDKKKITKEIRGAANFLA